MTDAILTGAVDIGGSKIQVGLVDGNGRVLCSDTFPTNSREQSGEQMVTQVTAALTALCHQQQVTLDHLQGIGVFCAGPVDTQTGCIENPYTLPGWEGFPLVHTLEKQTGRPVRLENDANGALLGEILLQDLHTHSVLMLTFGTGIGVANWHEGHLHRRGTYHPEMGHVLVAEHGPDCYCGQSGCFESLCSGTAIHRRAQQAGYADFDTLYAKRNDEAARQTLESIALDLQRGLWTLCLVFKPDTVILAGGFARAYMDFFEEALSPIARQGGDFVPAFTLLPAYQNQNTALQAALLLFDTPQE